MGNHALSRIRAFVARFERHFSATAFIVGFTLDAISLPPIDRPGSHFVLFGYLSIAAAGIAVGRITAGRTGRIGKIGAWSSLVVHFVFGGLWSALFVFYFRGAAFAGSWIFLLLLGGFFAATEFLRERYRVFAFQATALFVALFLVLAFFLPLLFARMDAFMFILSGLIAAGTVLFFTESLLIHDAMRKKERRVIRASIATTGVLIVALYGGGLIPPIPLALNHVGVYHAIERSSSDVFTYSVRGEETRWYDRWLGIARTYHRAPGESITVATVVFAPGKMTTPIRHEWNRYDPVRGAWTRETVVRFTISGGRKEGFRGWSTKTAGVSGRWRVDVTTEQGALLGRIEFDIVDVADPVLLTEAVL